MNKKEQVSLQDMQSQDLVLNITTDFSHQQQFPLEEQVTLVIVMQMEVGSFFYF